jgi:ankyrin repeat protein/tetratricopeptide (TPR) repeat protein
MLVLAIGWFGQGGVVSAASLDEAFQSALMAEEGRRDLTAAIRGYEEVVAMVDAQRALAATAVFRLGECYRKLGRTEEAVRHYQRLVRDFPGESVLVRLSRENLKALGLEEATGMVAGAGEGGAVGGSSAATGVAGTMGREQWQLLEERLKRLRGRRPDPETLAMVRTWFPDPLLERLALQLMEKALQAQRVKMERMEKVQQAREQGVDPNTVRFNVQQEALINEERDLEWQVDLQYHAVVKAQEETLAAIKAVQKGEETIAEAASGLPDEEEMELARLRGLRENSPDRLNSPGEDGLTPLGKAAQNGQGKVVEQLLAWGVDPLQRMEGNKNYFMRGLTALHLAAREGHRAVVLRLLDAGVDPNLVTKYEAILSTEVERGTVLSMAVARQHTGVVELLLERGADPKAEAFAYSLAAAIDADSPRMIERMVQAGATLESLGGEQDQPPLERALESNRREAARTLIRLGAKVEERTLWKVLRSEFMDGTWLGELLKAVPEELKASGGLDRFLVNAVVRSSRRLSGYPREPLLARLVPAFVQAGASADALVPDSQQSVMIYATPSVDRPVFEALLAAGPDLSLVEPKSGMTALHFAVKGLPPSATPDRLVRVRQLLTAGADPNIRDANQLTPLAYVEDALPKALRFDQKSSDMNQHQQELWQLRDLLLAAGAREDVTRRWYLSVKRGDNFERFFVRRSEDWVPLRLADFLSVFYSRNATGDGQLSLHFPAMDQLRIHRWAEDGSHEYVVPVASDWVTQSGCDWNVALEWGDALEIPEDLDRPANVPWQGLSSQDVLQALQKCTVRQVTVEVEGVSQKWKVLPEISPMGSKIRSRRAPDGTITITSAFLQVVLGATGQLRASSDLSRVRVIRPGTGQEWILDLQPPDTMNSWHFWLLDGDRVVVPSKQP